MFTKIKIALKTKFNSIDAKRQKLFLAILGCIAGIAAALLCMFIGEWLADLYINAH